MKVTVYHINSIHYFNEARTNFIDDYAQREYLMITTQGKVDFARQAIAEERYQKVAEVEVPDAPGANHWDALEYAWEKTNHITHAWQDNEEVTAIGDFATCARSSSVGDVFEVEVEGEIEGYICAPMGFDPLDEQ